MFKNPKLSVMVLFLLTAGVCLANLNIDFGELGQPVKSGFLAYSGNHNNEAGPFTYDVDGQSITVHVTVGGGSSGYREYGGEPLGTDMVYPDSGTGPVDGRVILTLSNLPAGAYSLKSYHNDSKDTHDQQDPINVTVSGNISSSTPAINVTQTKSLTDAAMGYSIVTFDATGSGEVFITYTPTTNSGLVSKAVLNGFELSLAGPVLPAVEFETDVSSGLEYVSPALIAVSISEAPADTVTVNYLLGVGTATSGSDFSFSPGTITFDPGQSAPEYINIDITNDLEAEDDETIVILLSDPVNSRLGGETQHTYTIVDPHPSVAFDTAVSQGQENVSPASVAVSLSNTWSETVTVNYAVTGGTAANGQDFSLASGTLSFDPGQTSKAITIYLVDDGLVEQPNETIELTLSAPSNARLGNITHHTFTILPPVPVPQPCPKGDLDGNCQVNYLDLEELASQWLDSGGCSGDDCADLDESLIVDMNDFAILAGNWQKKGCRVVINEFMVSNSRTQVDPDELDESPDWIELYNPWATAVDLSGMFLTDDLSDPTKWQVPSGVTIEPGEYLTFWADSDPEQGDTHTNFKLDESGEVVALFAADSSTLIDVVYFDDQPQSQDVSFGRYPDGSDNWRHFDMTTDPHPTPGSANEGFDIVINEIMYHPSSENDLEEYIELYNRGAGPVNLNGWQITAGVTFEFPDVTVGPGQCFVAAADAAAFSAKYPSVTNFAGPWTGKLSNKSESVELVDANGTRIDRVCYADEGDWSVRLRGPLDYGHYGWIWSDEHDGGGKSLELVNPHQTNWYGRNWAASTTDQGTPGAVNSVISGDVAPLIIDATHQPIIPRSGDTVTVTAKVIDELSSGATVRVYHRVDDSGAGFTVSDMYDDGVHGDGLAGDGVYGAQLLGQSDGSIVEFYFEASDAAANTRTWPSEVPGFGQAANLLYQVNDSYDPLVAWVPGSQPIYYLVLTEVERAELKDLGDDSNNNEDLSNAQMNATFISRDATGIQVRYNVGVRNRGHGSRHEPPMNYRVNFLHDNEWDGVAAVNLNSKFAHLQWLGSATFQLAGMPAPDTTIVQVRVNGENLVLADSRAYGSYARVEVKDTDWAKNHFPDDDNGNIYRCVRDLDQADLRYEGPDPGPYRDGYFKKTNEEYDDWSDLINMTNILNNAPDPNYLEQISEMINVEQWMRYLALDTLLINCESGLNTGQGDDYAIYRGVNDPRFILVNHDQDTYLRQGDHPECDENHDIFTFRQVNGLDRFLSHSETVPLYYQALLDLIDTIYSPEVMNQLIDDGLGGYVPASRRDAMKDVIVGRIAGVLAQVPNELTINCALPVVSGFYSSFTSTVVLDGTGNAAKTRSVLVNGQLADYNAIDGTWSVPTAVSMNPGINRIFVEAYDTMGGKGNLLESKFVDIWYYNGTESVISGTVSANTTMAAAAGPWHVTSDIVIPTGVTLTIEPGTTVFFDSGTGITVNGRLDATGTQYERIRLTRVPAGGNWDGLRFSNSIYDSRLAYADMDYGDTQGESIYLSNSQLLIDNVTWAGTNSTILEISNPYLIINNSVFPSISSEVIHGGSMPAMGYFVLRGNTFNKCSGNNDVIDFSGGKRPGPIFQVYNNNFLGGDDDGLDLDGTDAHVEGNIFTNFHYNGGEAGGTSSPIATGEAGGDNSDITAVRNIFYQNDHAALLKENCFMRAENNVFMDCSIAVLNFDEPGHASGPGMGAFMQGNIFLNNAQLLENFTAPVDVTVNSSILPSQYHWLGIDNIDSDPLLANPAGGDFSLLPGSPAIGTGPQGIDMGAMVPSGAHISGEPSELTYHTSAILTVSGPGIDSYRYRVNSDPVWSAEVPVSTPIQLNGLTNGTSYTVYAVGKNSAGVWQDPAEPTASKTWTVDLSATPNAGDVVINELLAHSDSNPDFDWIELHNTTNNPIDISGWFLSDNSLDLTKYQIQSPTIIAAQGYVVFREDIHFGLTSGDHGSREGFALSENGETLYLSSGNPGESVVTGYSEQESFGPSERDVAFGRYYKPSTQTTNFVAMSENTPGAAYEGAANAYPKVGPVVISEIMYHPMTNSDAEYIELVNISDANVTLYDYTTSEPWKFDDDGGFEVFFEPAPVKMAPGEYVLLVKDLTAFNSEFSAPPGTQIFSWGLAAGLSNGGEKIQLSMPGDLDGADRQYIRVDRVNYSDGSHGEDFPNLPADPWPTQPDGSGKSLKRKDLALYGNDVINWKSDEPSPGRAEP